MTTIVQAMDDAEAFGPWFLGSSWDGWRTILKGAYAIPMGEAELATFRTLAGGRAPPKKRVRELIVIAGRRAGKDSIASLLAANAAAIEENYVGRLRPGEQAHIYCIAADRQQAQIVQGYTRAFFHDIPDLRRMVVRETKLGLELDNNVVISIATNSFRQTRGRTLLLAILDECAYYRDETSATPDIELYRALTPSLATLPGSMMVLISSPYRRSGLLYERWKAAFGKDDDRTLVIQAPSIALNPTLDPAEIEADREKDPQAARSEWDGLFRDDIASYVPIEIVEDAVVPDRISCPPLRKVYYHAFVDPSGGSSDSMTLAISHREPALDDRYVLDLVLEYKPPFSPEAVVKEMAATLKCYRISKVHGDRFAGEWPREQFRKRGIIYEVAEKPKNEIYLAFLPLLNSGIVELLDDKKLVAQLCQLERRVQRGGRESIDHPRGLHDDIANAVAGALVLAAGRKQPMRISDAAARPFGAPTGGRGESFWYLKEGETGEDRLARMQKAARTMKVVNLDDDGKETLKGPILSARGG